MLRVYLTNDSYPELRDLPLGWARSRTWWRAIRHAIGGRDFWVFGATQVILIGAFFASGGTMVAHAGLRSFGGVVTYAVFGALAFGLFAYLQVSWGGDMMRSHLRAVNEVARHACPHCGHSLFAHVEAGGDEPVRCPECAAVVDRSVFTPPYRVPPESRVFPPWRR